MKHVRLFKTTAEFKAAKETLAKPNIGLIEETGKLQLVIEGSGNEQLIDDVPENSLRLIFENELNGNYVLNTSGYLPQCKILCDGVEVQTGDISNALAFTVEDKCKIIDIILENGEISEYSTLKIVKDFRNSNDTTTIEPILSCIIFNCKVAGYSRGWNLSYAASNIVIDCRKYKSDNIMFGYITKLDDETNNRSIAKLVYKTKDGIIYTSDGRIIDGIQSEQFVINNISGWIYIEDKNQNKLFEFNQYE